MSTLGKKLRLCEGGMVLFKCPGCRETHGVYTAPAANGSARPMWGFNGDGDRPTFTPSVLVRTGHHRVCHSFVTDGQIQFLSDCTHELAGQTVPLPDFED